MRSSRMPRPALRQQRLLPGRRLPLWHRLRYELRHELSKTTAIPSTLTSPTHTAATSTTHTTAAHTAASSATDAAGDPPYTHHHLELCS